MILSTPLSEDDVKRINSLRGRYTVEVKKIRTPRMNKYYWIMMEVAVPFLREQGWIIKDKDDSHKFFTTEFLTGYIQNENGQIKSFTKSTSSLSVKQMEDYWNQIWMYLSELGCVMMSPEEYKKNEGRNL